MPIEFYQKSAAETQQAARHLVNILGSVEAANAYLAQMVKGDSDRDSEGEQGQSQGWLTDKFNI